MFTRKHKTVTSIMETFKVMITDLEEITINNMTLCVILMDKRTAINTQIEEIDLEVHRANNTAARLHNLVFGTSDSKKSDE